MLVIPSVEGIRALPFFKRKDTMLELLMLAQAQESFYLKANRDKKNPAVLARCVLTHAHEHVPLSCADNYCCMQHMVLCSGTVSSVFCFCWFCRLPDCVAADTTLWLELAPQSDSLLGYNKHSCCCNLQSRPPCNLQLLQDAITLSSSNCCLCQQGSTWTTPCALQSSCLPHDERCTMQHRDNKASLQCLVRLVLSAASFNILTAWTTKKLI